MNDIYSFVKYGDPCLDFVNSKVWNTRVEPFTDLFVDYEHMVHWFMHLAIMDEVEINRLLSIAYSKPEDTHFAFERIVTLRDTNYRILTAIAHQEIPKPQDLDILNSYYNEAMAHRRVVLTTDGIGWTWVNKEERLDWMLWPIAYSTAELLTSERALRIRECHGCYWMFIDTSRNGLRRWCDMKTCGNRAKAHRHYERVKAANS